MSCKPIKLADGSTILAMLKPGAVLTEDEVRAIAEYVEFCRARTAKKRASKGKSLVGLTIPDRLGGNR